MDIPKRGGTYPVEGKEEPDAWLVQELANDARIRTQVVLSEQNAEYAKAVVRAIAPDGTWTESSVIHHFETVKVNKALEYLKKDFARVQKGEKTKIFQNVEQPFDDQGRPILIPNGILILLTSMQRFKTISVRDAESKAARRAQLKMLNHDWRDKWEKLEELAEVKMVSEDISERKELSGPAAIPTQKIELPPSTPRAPVAPKATEATESELTAALEGVPAPETGKAAASPKLPKKPVKKLVLPPKPNKASKRIPMKTLDDDGNEIKEPDNLAKETIIDRDSGEKAIERAAEELKQQLVTEKSDVRLQELKNKPILKLTPKEKIEMAELQEKARLEGNAKAIKELDKVAPLMAPPEGYDEQK